MSSGIELRTTGSAEAAVTEAATTNRSNSLLACGTVVMMTSLYRSREQLLQEREFFVDEHNEQLYEREFSLCEH
ncbi:hypothetical protein [Streptomyces sp. NPDC056670]|uniref:hypothetical protein n=1 Tax=Streptomyces sp. NPDC056670 TaxID=3345904 RepID=UPI0036B3FBF4